MAAVRDFRELDVYQRAFSTATRVFEISRDFPRDERFSLTDQIRRSARSVCGNIAEAWRKRRYINSFISKLSDADAEAGETTVWIDFALTHGFIDSATHAEIREGYDHINGQLVRMMNDADRWCGAYRRDTPS